MHTLVIILLVIAAIMFALEAIGVATRVNLLAVGLLSWVLAALVPLLL